MFTWIYVIVWWYEFVPGDTLFLRTCFLHCSRNIKVMHCVLFLKT